MREANKKYNAKKKHNFFWGGKLQEDKNKMAIIVSIILCDAFFSIFLIKKVSVQ